MRSLILLTATGLLTNPSTLTGQETKIERSALPAAVERTVAAQVQDAAVLGFTRERENGQTYYEVETSMKGMTRDVLIDSSGAVVEIEQEVAFDSLPEAVKAAIQARAGTAKITAVESITKGDRLVAYEAHLIRDGKRSEIQTGPEGQKLEHEE